MTVSSLATVWAAANTLELANPVLAHDNWVAHSSMIAHTVETKKVLHVSLVF